MPDQVFIISRPPEASPLTEGEIKAILNTQRSRYEWCVLEITKLQQVDSADGGRRLPNFQGADVTSLQWTATVKPPLI